MVKRQTSRPDATHRSGAVARMLDMPVATLRVWERRYGVTQAPQSASGQRLYSAADVQRLALLRQLSQRGHAIGSLAGLDMAQLQQVALSPAQLKAAAPAAPAPAGPAPVWRVAVVGAALAERLARPALLRRLGRPLVLYGPFADAAQAAKALKGQTVDALLLHETQLQPDWLAGFKAAAPKLAQLPKAVLYGFAAEAVCDALAAAGVSLLREPQPDAVLAQWLQGLATPQHRAPQPAPAADTPPRRWNDAAVAAFVSRSSTMPCECPRHVAELLMQLSHFEAYSAQCAHRNAADAQLHAHLGRLAAASRASFEAALEQVALHVGLLLPSAR